VDPFAQWRYYINSKLASSKASNHQSEDIKASVDLVCSMSEAVRVSKDVGYETAIREFNRKLKEKKRQIERAALSCPQSLFSYLSQFIYDSAYIKTLPNSIQGEGRSAAPECGRFPKFRRLVEILSGYKNATNFHGMVFVGTRTAADQMTSMLQTTNLIKHMAFRKIVGQSKAAKNQLLGTDNQVST